MPAVLALPARPLMMNYRTTHRVLDTAKLRDLLSYRDVVPARQAVRLATRWLVANPLSAVGMRRPPYRTLSTMTPRIAWWQKAIADPPNIGYDELPGLREVLCRTRHPEREGQHADLMVQIPSARPYLRGKNLLTPRSVCPFPGASGVVLVSNPEDGKY
jgi:hypothetical protein